MAIKKLKDAIDTDETFIPPYVLLAKIYNSYGRFDQSIELYKVAAEIDDNSSLYVNLAFLEMKVESYKDAKEHILKAQSYEGNDRQIQSLCNELLETINFRIEAKENPVLFIPKNLGKNINSVHSEYLPALTADEQTLIITVGMPKKVIRSEYESKVQEDFFISKKVNGKWTKAENMGKSINTSKNEGAQSISADGQYLYFTACNRVGGRGNCDLYMSQKIGDNWGRAKNLKSPINSPYWDAQPCISVDGKTLYFASSRPNGIGKMDIWKSVWQEDKNKWSKPENLGENINTTEDDFSPFLHTDNETLYFTSNGWIGMGGNDIFFSRKNKKGVWSKPKNLGYPINTSKDESSLIVNAKGDKAYFSAEREEGFGLMDLYEFELYDEARPSFVTYLKGKVFDAKTKKILKADFELIDLESNEIMVKSKSNNGNGEFLVPLPTNKNYALNVSKDGYLFYSENFSLKNLDEKDKVFIMDIPLQAIEKNKKVILKNIFFETNSFILKTESKTELLKLKRFLLNNPNLEIEISGHTDNIGKEMENLILSENRAKSVFNYLVKEKISSKRITYKGYGEKKPISTNKTDEGRKVNRRTEFKIIK